MKNGHGEPKYRYYSYRVEFQARGLPHIHGALWLDIDWLKEWLHDQWINMNDFTPNSTWWKNKEDAFEEGRIEFDLDTRKSRNLDKKIVAWKNNCSDLFN